MSVVAYRNGVMASDSRAYAGSGQPSPGSKAKTRRLDDGTLIGCVSNCVGGSEYMLKWYADGMPNIDVRPDCFTLLVVKPSGEMYVADDSVFLSGPIESEFYAIGSGRKYALGAMEMGAGPEYACEIACRFDPFSGAPIRALTHGGD